MARVFPETVTVELNTESLDILKEEVRDFVGLEIRNHLRHISAELAVEMMKMARSSPRSDHAEILARIEEAITRVVKKSEGVS